MIIFFSWKSLIASLWSLEIKYDWQQSAQKPFIFSMASVKRRALNDHLLDTFISMLELSPTVIKSHPNYQNLRSYGVIAA
ncbi:MAG: hypothetical protein RMX65_018965 [Nostoc sp. DedQUE01]